LKEHRSSHSIAGRFSGDLWQ